jgi:hypothetical protein
LQQITRDEIPSHLYVPPATLITIDPKSNAFKQIVPVCDPANPFNCLAAAFGQISLGVRVSFSFDHTVNGPVNGKLSVFFGDGFRAVKDAPPDLLRMADRFDFGKSLTTRVRVLIDFDDLTWSFYYRDPSRPEKGEGSTGRVNRPRNGKNRHNREKTLREVRKIQAGV